MLYAKDLTIFIRRRHRFGLHRLRKINDVPYQDCYTWFGQYQHNLRRLHEHLRVPESFMLPTGKIYGEEECFLIYLYHITKGTLFREMTRFVFGGDPRRLLEINIFIYKSRVHYILQQDFRPQPEPVDSAQSAHMLAANL